MSGSGSRQVHPDSAVRVQVPVSVETAPNSSEAAWIRWRPAEGLGRSQVALGALDGPEKNLALAAVMVGMGAGQRVMR
jgi:hypothetical protein